MYRIQITAQNNSKRYLDLDGDDIDVAVQLAQELGQGETYKKAEFKYTENPHREGDKVILRIDGVETEYQTVKAAQAEADKLADDEGYEILSLEQPRGSKPTVVIKSRPSLKDGD